MSLTSMIQYNDNWKYFFKENIPKKTAFKTLSGHLAFSSDYEELAEYNLSNSYYSRVVGTAFDYLARWIVAKTVSHNKEQAFEDLVAENGIYLCRYIAYRENIDIQDIYEKALKVCKKYLNATVDKSEIIAVSILFAKLEQIARRGSYPFDIDLKYIMTCESEIINDLERLYDLFEEKFILSGLVTEKSQVVYNPTFGGASVICGGADADIYIDGTLYDFKCTKKHGYVWNDVAQILGYYLLDNIAKNNNDEDNCLNGYEIKRIAFYRARYGEVEYIDVSKEKYQNLINSFEQILGKDNYQKYLEEQEQEKIKQAKKIQEEQERLQKEQYELQAIIKRGNKDELTLYKMKKILGFGDYFDQEVRRCKNEKQKRREIKRLIEVFYNSRVYDKINSEKIKHIMHRENITVDKISKKLNRTPATVKNWIAGRSMPSLGTYIELLNILKCKRTDIAEIKDEFSLF